MQSSPLLNTQAFSRTDDTVGLGGKKIKDVRLKNKEEKG